MVSVNMWTTSKLGVVLTFVCGFCAVLGALSSESDDEWTKHHNYEAMLGVLKDVHEKCPSITYLYNLTGHPDRTTQGRRLAVLVISDNPERHEIGTTSYSVLIHYSFMQFTVGLKIEIHEIHEIHQNLRNPVSILIKFHSLQQNPLI